MPKASARKKAYDTKYHSSPQRRAYRACLNRERRKRGVYGKGGDDMDHTGDWKECKVKPRNKSSNRAAGGRKGGSR